MSSARTLEAVEGGGWRFRHWCGPRVVAGLTDRHVGSSQLLRALEIPETIVEAAQVHGSSLAVVGRSSGESVRVVQGADALLTETPDVVLCIRTADCLPMFFASPSRGAIGVAHAGWRGLSALLPIRTIAAFRHTYHARADDLHVAIGPAIRSCCYEVGPEFATRFGRFVQERQGRQTCDLIGIAVHQLLTSGVRPEHIVDSARCTACEPQRWFSVRKEGDATGRLASFIVLRP